MIDKIQFCIGSSVYSYLAGYKFGFISDMLLSLFLDVERETFWKYFFAFEKLECGPGLDKWPYIWTTVGGPGGRLNMFWSRPHSFLVTLVACKAESRTVLSFCEFEPIVTVVTKQVLFTVHMVRCNVLETLFPNPRQTSETVEPSHTVLRCYIGLRSSTVPPLLTNGFPIPMGFEILKIWQKSSR